MKGLKLFIVAPLLASGLVAGCSQEDKVTLNVYAAASLTETLTQLKTLYASKKANVEIVYNFDSSGTLQDQILNGAECDLFFSAAPKQMNKLEESNLINKETRVNVLENKVALAVPSGNPKAVTSFDNMADRLKADEADFLVAIGNETVPVGQYTEKIFTYYSINKTAIASHLTLGTNVKAVTTAVTNNAVACGIIYQTDAHSANLQVVGTATKDMCGQVIYPAAVTANSKYQEASKEFLDFLRTDEALKVFESVGFSRM